jgi:hypothetical protein
MQSPCQGDAKGLIWSAGRKLRVKRPQNWLQKPRGNKRDRKSDGASMQAHWKRVKNELHPGKTKMVQGWWRLWNSPPTTMSILSWNFSRNWEPSDNLRLMRVKYYIFEPLKLFVRLLVMSFSYAFVSFWCLKCIAGHWHKNAVKGVKNVHNEVRIP